MVQDLDNPSKTTNPDQSNNTNIAEPTSNPPAPPSPSKKSSPPTNAVAKKEVEPPAFEKGIIDQIAKEFGKKINVVYIRPLRMKILVDAADILAVAIFLRDNLGFDHAESVGGTDYTKDNQIEVIYHLGSYGKQELEGHVMALATRTFRDPACRLPSLVTIFRSVEYHERETFEMLGVYFEGHPRNERFLLPEDWADIPPLRKEFRIKGR